MTETWPEEDWRRELRPLSTDRLAELLGGELDSPRQALVYGFATDHRHVKAGDAFLAIKGANFDGHQFAQEAIKAGAVVVVAERPVSAPHILVPNLVDALARFGSELRSTFEGPVIGITGSAGKTTTKEFLASALSPLGKVLKTEGNKNTEYTAPLMWAGLESDTQVAVVEMAMRGFDQISHLASFARPTIGIVTNIGYGHMEMVESREGIARAKGELLHALPADGIAILWAEDDYLTSLREAAGDRRVLTFGTSADADCRITSYQPLDWNSAVVEGEVSFGERVRSKWRAQVPAIGSHIALNAAAAVLAAAVVGVDPAQAARHIAEAKLPPMRMELREVNGATVILDTYNASPPAVLAAIEALTALPVKGRRLVVIGEMKELGEHTERLHREVGQLLGKSGLSQVLFYGDPMEKFAREEAIRSGLDANNARIARSLEDVRAFLQELKPGDAALVKGSRALALEQSLELAEA
jgi:UDP-N-acetylmuramoyl-tripeptide--D-alanyl-D-alanine ligase